MDSPGWVMAICPTLPQEYRVHDLPALRHQHINLPKLRNDFFRCMYLPCHRSHPPWSKPYFREDHFKGGRSILNVIGQPPHSSWRRAVPVNPRLPGKFPRSDEQAADGTNEQASTLRDVFR